MVICTCMHVLILLKRYQPINQSIDTSGDAALAPESRVREALSVSNSMLD